MAKLAQKEQDLILSEAQKRFELAIDAWKANREKGEEDLMFLIGEQWPDDIRAARESAGRPCLTINKLPATVDQVIGDSRQNKLSIKVRPVDDRSDPAIAEILEGLIRNIEVCSDAEVAYQTALESAVTCGFGWFRLTIEYSDEDSFDREIRIRRVLNPFSVFFDPNAEEADGSDARWAFVTEMVPRSEFEARYPKIHIADYTPDDNEWKDWFDLDGHIRIAEYWRRVPKTKTIGLLSDGRTVDLDEIQSVLDELEQAGIRVVRERRVESHQVEWYLLAGGTVLDGPITWPVCYIPIIPVFGKETIIKGERHLRSLIRHAKDPQRAYNYWRTASTELVALAPKAPFMVTPEQIEGHELQWQQASAYNFPYLLYNSVANASLPQRVMPPAIPSGAIQETQIANDDLKATTGIFDASLGNRGNETSGRAILARQREGDISTFAFHDNLRRAIQHAGKILVDLIPKVYDTARTIRVLGPDEAEKAVKINQTIVDAGTGQQVIINDLTVGKYDVVVQTGPSYSTRRLEAAESMIELIKAAPQLLQVVGDLLVKNMDWPGAEEISDRLKRLLPPQLQSPTQGLQPPGPGGPVGLPPAGGPPNPQMIAQRAELQGRPVDDQRQAAVLDQARQQIIAQQVQMAAAQRAAQMRGLGNAPGM